MLGVIGFIINGVRGSGVVGFWGLGFAVWGLQLQGFGLRLTVAFFLLWLLLITLPTLPWQL